jgi:WS/DGAT/MGAT family acyltransferase
MRQLRGEDAQFVYADNGHANSNLTLVSIYDPSTAADGRVHFTGLLKHIESRLHLSPIFRQKLLRVPLELDHPYWIEDERFDLEYHVRHVALPKPGDWRQFCIQASRIHARPLDMTRPLWELYLVEGLDAFVDLPKSSFAILAKIHHAAIDANAGAEITTLLHDTTPRAPELAPPEPWFPETPPGIVALLARAALNNATHPLKGAAPLARAVGRLSPTVLGSLGDAWLHPERRPVTRFNSVVSPHRVFETRRFTIEEFKRIRGLVPGATVNDAVLAVCGGALRRYLGRQEELPGPSLVSIVPVSRRRAEGGGHGYNILHVPLRTDLEDPVRRLRSIKRFVAAASDHALAVSARELTDFRKHVPAATLALSARMMAGAALRAGHRAPVASCTITNVPGPAIPLYLDGARMTYFSAIMPIYDGMGLVIAVTSYNGGIIISPTSCREQMPDPEFFAQCIRDSFQEYLAVADRRRKRAPRKASAATRPRPKPTTPRRRRAA